MEGPDYCFNHKVLKTGLISVVSGAIRGGKTPRPPPLPCSPRFAIGSRYDKLWQMGESIQDILTP